MTIYKVEVAKDRNDLAKLANSFVSAYLSQCLDQRDRIQIALAGGSTPSDTYKRLGKELLPWERIDVFLGDERCVDLDDQNSNSLMINKTLLDCGPASKARFYPIPTKEDGDPNKMAAAFADLLRNFCKGNPPIFDLILLGLGDDGHTASLFPSTEVLSIKDQWTYVSEGKGLNRITLTSPVLSAARKVVFLVSGKSKRIALERLLDPSESSNRTPAKLVRPNSEVLVLADKDSAY